MFRICSFVFVIAMGAGLLVVAGCKQPTPTPTEKTPDEHTHKPGAHGGLIVSVGTDRYHAEALLEKGGVLRLFMLGKDDKVVLEVAAETLTAFVKPSGAAEAVQIELKAEPQKGDQAGKTSQFVGKLAAELQNKKIEVTIPSLAIAGERFRVAFTLEPPVLATDKQREIHLKPGGIYTEADIQANGNTTPTEKYVGFHADHNTKPKVGDRICPITDTKANPKCVWIVGGKTYQFCCPPCIDEFVTAAKTKPETIKAPEQYVQTK